MRHGRRIVRASLAAAALAASSLVTLAPPAHASAGSDCGTKQYRWLFWPQGHKAVPSVSFPEFLTPHLELYTGKGKKFPDSQLVGYVDPAGAKVSTTACQVGTGAESKPATLTKTVSKPTMLVCTFAANPLINAAQAVGGGGALLAYVNDSAGAYAVMKTTGSTLQYDPKACKVKKPPH